jgi:hypothetical protein
MLLIDKMGKGDALARRTGSTAAVFAVCSRLYLCYLFTGDKTYLHRAYHAASARLENDGLNYKLHYLLCVISQEQEYFERARDLLNAMKKNRNHFKAAEPALYSFHIYCETIINIGANKRKAAEKGRAVLTEYAAEKSCGEAYLAAGAVAMKVSDYTGAYRSFGEAVRLGVNSAFLYTELFT